MHDSAEWDQVAPSLDLPPEMIPRIVAMLRRERLSLLVSLRAAASPPDWIGPAAAGGYLAIFSGRWAPLARLWEEFPRLYGSSANRTGQRPPRPKPRTFSAPTPSSSTVTRCVISAARTRRAAWFG